MIPLVVDRVPADGHNVYRHIESVSEVHSVGTPALEQSEARCIIGKKRVESPVMTTA